jgi:hypothetical protein
LPDPLDLSSCGDSTRFLSQDHWQRKPLNSRCTMKASVGDRLVVKGLIAGAPSRDGEVLAVEGPDGEPPYLVRWSDTGRQSLFFPGAGAYIAAPPGHEGRTHGAGPAWEHTRTWEVEIFLDENEEQTTAHAVLHTQAPVQLEGRGSARHRTEDDGVPEIGDEIATARALRRLADRLLATAADDLAGLHQGGGTS